VTSIPPGHFGMATMRERADAIGATFALSTQPERGTRIEMSWRQSEDPIRA
jgi:signal transduction histidine kinase